MPLKEDGVYFVLCPKQGIRIEGIVLNRACILRLFVLKRVRVSNPQWLTKTQTLVDYPHPVGSSQPSKGLAVWK